MTEREMRIKVWAKSIGTLEHQMLRDAIDAASVSGDMTWIENSAGARIAAIVPLDVAEAGLASRPRQE